jgi:hypothetical protein
MTAPRESADVSQAMNDTPGLFIAVCPNCLLSLRVNYEYSGRLVRCRHCNEAFRPFSPDFGPAPTSGSAEYAVGPITRPEDRPDLIVSCPSCATTLSVRAQYAGRHVRCGSCRHKFRVAADGGRPGPPRSGPADDEDARTPDPDVAPGEVERLIHEVAALREQNERLVGRLDELRGEITRLEARIDQLESDREEAAAREVAPNIHRLVIVDPASRPTSDDDHDDHRSTFSFQSERSVGSGR